MTCQDGGVEAAAVIDDEAILANLEVLDAQVALCHPRLLGGGRIHLIWANGQAVGPQCSCLLKLSIALQQRATWSVILVMTESRE